MLLKNRISYPLFIAALVGVVLFSCRKNEEFLSEPVIDVPPPTVINDTEFLGTAHDELGEAISGTTVTLYHNSLAVDIDIADSKGNFSFRDVPFSDTAYVLHLVHGDFSTTNRSYRTTGHVRDEMAVEMPSLPYFQTAAEIDMTNTELVSITGIIQDTEGQPAEGIVTIKDGNLNIHEHVVADHTGQFEAFVAKGIEYDFTLTSFCGHTFVEEIIGPYSKSQNLGVFVSETPGRLLAAKGTVKNCNGTSLVNEYLILKHNEDFPTIITSDESGRFALGLHDCQIEGDEITVLAYDREAEKMSEPTSLTQLNSDFEFGEIVACTDDLPLFGIMRGNVPHLFDLQYAHVSDGKTYFRSLDPKNEIRISIPFVGATFGEVDSFEWYLDGELFASKEAGTSMVISFSQFGDDDFSSIEGMINSGSLYFSDTQAEEEIICWFSVRRY